MARARAARTLEAFRQLGSAEEYLDFFGIGYDAEVLAAGRLPILLRFARDLAAIDARDPAPPEPERLELYERALRQAYTVHRWSAPEEQKLLNVFRGGGGCSGCSGASGCGA